MKRFSLGWLLIGLLAGAFMMGGCEKKDWRQPEKVHWDRDMCERCKMAVSERKYAAEVIDPKTHKHYKFDDIGCAILWFKEEKLDWIDQAIIWGKDGKSGQWIDARKAYYSTDKIPPMGYGFTAYANKADAGNGEVIGFEEVVRRVIKRGR
jgi:nitrous oxide reductase accessory protein NosL